MAPLLPVLFSPFFKEVIVFLFFHSAAMETAVRFSALARDLPLVEYAWEFCRFAVHTLDDATLNFLFWIGTNYYRPVDLPETTGLSWREGILRCLECVQPRSRTSPPSSARELFTSQASQPFPSQARCPPLTQVRQPPKCQVHRPSQLQARRQSNSPPTDRGG